LPRYPSTPHVALPAAVGPARFLRPSAFKLTLIISLACLGLRFWELGRSGSLVPVLRTLEHALGDLRFRERAALGRAKAPTHVVVVTADEKSINEIGLWPWPRPIYADLIDKLTAAGATAVVFDVAFVDRSSRMDASGDQALADAIAKSGKTVQAFILLFPDEAAPLDPVQRELNISHLEKAAIDQVRAPENGRLYPDPAAEAHLESFSAARAPIDPVWAAATWFGYYNAYPDEDGVLRRTPMLARLAGHLLLPSIELSGYAVACGAPAPRLITPLAAGRDEEVISALEVPCEGGSVAIPVESDGQMLLNYQVGWNQMPIVSTVDVRDGKFPRGTFSGKVALIAATAQGTYDLRSSPLDSNVPGGVTHATALEQMLSGRLLTRPGWLRVFELLLLLGLGLGFGWLFATLGPLPAVGTLFVGLFLVHALSVGLFISGYDAVSALPLLQLILMAPTALIFRYLTEEREKRFIRNAFRYYLTPSVMEAVLADPSKLRLGGEKRELTVLFSDVRGFTQFSEKLQPEQLVTLLNRYLTPMTDLVFEHGGTLDKYMGDAIMAFYGAPLEQPDHALRAVKTADSMMRALATLAPEWQAEGLPKLDIGIGINSGPMVVGNMGSESRFDYTVMGDAVNLGSRLEGTNKVYGTHVILSEDTEALVRGEVTTRELDSVRVKGKHKPVRIYELIAIGAPPPEWVEVLESYQRGLDLYRQRDFAGAAAAFEGVLERRPHDKPAEIYLRRCRDLEAQPPAPDWDGVLDLLTK